MADYNINSSDMYCLNSKRFYKELNGKNAVDRLQAKQLLQARERRKNAETELFKNHYA